MRAIKHNVILSGAKNLLKGALILGLFLPLFLTTQSCKYPRCKIKACKTRMIHGHGMREYRPRAFWKKQNLKTGETFENPNYENK